MKTKISLLGALLILALFSSGAHAVALILAPNAQNVGVGSQVSVDVRAINLAGDFVGAYDFNVSWDPTLLDFINIEFSPYLDGPSMSTQSFDEFTPGTLSVSEFSSGSLSMQDGTPFTLFTLTFDALAVGTSDFHFTAGGSPGFDFLADAFGETLDVEIREGKIRIDPVPVPAAVWFLLSGLAAIGMRARRARTH